MKNLIYLAILTFLPSSVLLANNGNRAIEGYWYAQGSKKSIQIKSTSYGLKIKGLSWERKFRSVGHRTFSNFEGTKVKIERGGVLKVTNQRRTGWGNRTRVSVKYFYKDGPLRGSRSGYNDRYDDRYDDYGSGRFDEGQGFGSGSYDGYNNGRPINRSNARSAFLGEWKTIGLERNHRVVITSSSTGIKAKFKNSDEWIFYAQSNENPNVFRDRRGNRYVLDSRNTAHWYGINGKEFSLTKRD